MACPRRRATRKRLCSPRLSGASQPWRVFFVLTPSRSSHSSRRRPGRPGPCPRSTPGRAHGSSMAAPGLTLPKDARIGILFGSTASGTSAGRPRLRVDRCASAARAVSGRSAVSAILRRMFRFPLLGSALLLACGVPEIKSQKLADGSWSVACDLPMEDCIRHVEKTCRSQRYRILEATSETRVRDVPPMESTYHTSRLHLFCNHGDGELPLSVETAPKPPVAAAPGSSPLCTTGQTRECVGPAACKGGQSCLPDHSGFSACDCGPPQLPSPLPPANSTVSPPPSLGSAPGMPSP
jgi:hypothetical protein